MFEPPDHYRNLSLRLSEVMDDIGVNERIVMKRRRCFLLTETMGNIEVQINGSDESRLFFGSQSEGSTTLQLRSDIDIFYCVGARQIILIQDWSDWQLHSDKLQLLMVQDETTSPGYCLLQLLRMDAPLPMKEFQVEHFTRDSKGRILLKHSIVLIPSFGRIRHGPAQAMQGIHGQLDSDFVAAMFCSSWPKEAVPWLQKQNMSGWPTENMKRYAAGHGCFVVAVASRESPNQDTEWRISTSLAERCSMFSINMTQLRCYILMKMILKTFFQPLCKDAVSSFMCKTVLFHCIAGSTASEWNASYLIIRLNQCLHVLCNCILTENCPHFIIPRNNLLAGKLSIPVKEQLVEIICNLTGNIGQSLLGITIDQLGNRLIVKSGGRLLAGHLPSPELNAGQVIASIISRFASDHRKVFRDLTQETIYPDHVIPVCKSLIQVISTLCQIYSVGSKMEQVACRYITPLVCASLGSIAASIDIYHFQSISPVALMWFSAGLNTDFSSTRLKLASALYCAGQYHQCETILAELSCRLDQTAVVSVCSCCVMELKHTGEYSRICNEKHEEDVIKQNIAFCVTFLPCEMYCVPEELRYEFFRSTEEDRAYRGDLDYWMNWIAVDSLTYLQFMKYKVYTQLRRPTEKYIALYNLSRTMKNDPNLVHMETALNLLGQCMEQENELNVALFCYMFSLNSRRTNNAAEWHVCRLLSRHFRHSQ